MNFVDPYAFKAEPVCTRMGSVKTPHHIMVSFLNVWILVIWCNDFVFIDAES